MAFYFEEPSHTFSEYLPIPGCSSTRCIPPQMGLKTPLIRYRKGTGPDITINIPMVSVTMQSVSDDRMAIALTQEDGVSFIHGSQAIRKQVEMIHKAKRYRADFVVSDSSVSPDMTLADVLAIMKETGRSTIAVTVDGKPNGELLGIATNEDYRVSRMGSDTKVRDFMTTPEDSVYADKSTTLKEANDIIQEHKVNYLPLANKNQELVHLVLRRDYDTHKKDENRLIDSSKRYMVGAGTNARDYAGRVPAPLEARMGAPCVGSSRGFFEWQKIIIDYTRKNYGNLVKVGAGNVMDGDGFRFLAEAGVDFTKMGTGDGAICITREQKGIGRGQATALVEVAKARDEYCKETGAYISIYLDGGITYDCHITLALTTSASFIMLGRYFARSNESSTKRVSVNGSYMEEYWGEGNTRARNWQRYDMDGDKKLSFEEGMDSPVPYTGNLKDSVNFTLSKVCSTMCNYGALTIPELQEKAEITLVSSTSMVEGGVHGVMLKDKR